MAEHSDTRPDPAFIRIENVTKKFGSFTAVDNVSLDIGRGELFALLGGSGCGKTTLLRMLAGFEAPTSGRIMIDGQDMTGVAPFDRPVNMMFQSYALFPHMSVEKNVGYGLKHENMTDAQRKNRVRELLGQEPYEPSQKIPTAQELLSRMYPDKGVGRCPICKAELRTVFIYRGGSGSEWRLAA